MSRLCKHGSAFVSSILKNIQRPCPSHQCKIYPRHFCSTSSSSNKVQVFCERLHNRDILRLHGKDTSNLMQGLITNDMNLFEDPQTSCIYSLMLNLQGRVLYDIILYKCDKGEFFLECDKSLSDGLIKHLKKYRLRKKVEIDPAGTHFTLWALFKQYEEDALDEEVVKSQWPMDLKSREKVVLSAPDPRLPVLGHRLILKQGDAIEDALGDVTVSSNGSMYMQLRYKLGVGEGMMDFPPDNCFPLDSNGDLLHGISFTKGCYLGQELTSRTYHTGVVRKRLMPIQIADPSFQNVEVPPSAIIVNEEDKNLGRHRNHYGKYGIAMLKIKDSLNSKDLAIKQPRIKITTKAPVWWPEEALKDAAH